MELLTEGEGLSTVDLLIKATCFVKEVNNTFNVEPSLSKQVSTWRSTVLSLPLHLVFLAQTLEGRISRYVCIGTVYSIVVLKNASDSDSDSDCTCLRTRLSWYMGQVSYRSLLLLWTRTNSTQPDKHGLSFSSVEVAVFKPCP
jgi:hypothetical protein